jgi:hypothetical protein
MDKIQSVIINYVEEINICEAMKIPMLINILSHGNRGFIPLYFRTVNPRVKVWLRVYCIQE